LKEQKHLQNNFFLGGNNMAFETKGFIDGEKAAIFYQTTDTIAVCSANDYFEQSQVGNLIVIFCSNGEKM
jgi:hypothetical protein